jgi:hypothetical protein
MTLHGSPSLRNKHRDKSWMKTCGLRQLSAAIALESSPSTSRARGVPPASPRAPRSGGFAFIASTGLKYAVGRARPTRRGQEQFSPSPPRMRSSFRRHTRDVGGGDTYARVRHAVALRRRRAPNLALRSREHWFSDTVARSFSAALGHLAWKGRREARRRRCPSGQVALPLQDLE